MKVQEFIEKGNRVCELVKNEILAKKDLAEKVQRMIVDEEIEDIDNIWILEGLLTFNCAFSLHGNEDTGRFEIHFGLTKSEGAHVTPYGSYSSVKCDEDYILSSTLEKVEDKPELWWFLENMTSLKDEIIKAIELRVDKELA